jgi:hypothetical protein
VLETFERRSFFKVLAEVKMKSILSVLKTKHLWFIVLPITLMLGVGKTTSASEPQLEVSVGVFGRCDSSDLGTFFAFRIKNADGSSIELNDVKVTVLGPDNWGTGDRSFTMNDTLPRAFGLTKKPIAGTYTLSIPVNGTTISNTMTLTDTTTKPLCPIASFQTQTTNELTLNLTQTTGLASYRLGVGEGTSADYKKRAERTTSLSPSINGLDGIMDATKFNWLELTASNADLTSATTPLPSRITNSASYLPIIVAPIGSSYNMSASYGTLVDSRYPGKIFTSIVWELKNFDGSSPVLSTYSYATYPPEGTLKPTGVMVINQSANVNTPGVKPESIYSAPIAGIPYTTRVLANGQRYETTGMILEADQTLGFATNPRVTSANRTSIGVAWTPPIGSSSYEVNIYDDTHKRVGYKVVSTPSAVLQDFVVPLKVGTTYQVEIFAYSFNRKANNTLPKQHTKSRVCGTFILTTSTPETVLTPYLECAVRSY